MIDSIITPVAIVEAEIPVEPLNVVLNSFVRRGVIPIAVIDKEDNELYQMMLKGIPENITLKYLIITVEYKKTFEA